MSTHRLQFNEPRSDEEQTNMELMPFQWSPKLQNPLAQYISKQRAVQAPIFQQEGNVDSPQFTIPLSELTKHLTHIPIRDMENWVRRPLEIRHRHISGMNGKVTRPMNCFMLYRSAYADRTKTLFSIGNYRVVSQLTGESWKSETLEIKRKYRRLASIEKSNHLIAHPRYKFSPKRKVQQAKQCERIPSVHHLDTPGLGSTLTQDYAKCLTESNSGSIPLSPSEPGLPLTYTWPTKNSSNSSSKIQQSTDRLHQHLQPHNLQHHNGRHIQDGLLSSIELQDLQHSPSTALVGLPEAINHDPILPQSDTVISEMISNHIIDPQMLELNGNSSNPIAAPQGYSELQHHMCQDIPTSNGYLPTTDMPFALDTIAYFVNPPYMESQETRELRLSSSMDTLIGDFSCCQSLAEDLAQCPYAFYTR